MNFDEEDDDDATYGDYDSRSGRWSPSGRQVAEAVTSASLLQYALAFGLLVGALVIFKALIEWTPGPQDNRTFWEKIEGKPR